MLAGRAAAAVGPFRQRYNEARLHWALVPAQGGDPITPADVYVQGQVVGLPKWQGWAKAARKKLARMTEEIAATFEAAGITGDFHRGAAFIH